MSDYGPYHNIEGIPYSLFEECRPDGTEFDDYCLCDRPDEIPLGCFECPCCKFSDVYLFCTQILVVDCEHCGTPFECWRHTLELQERHLKERGLWGRWCLHYGLTSKDELLPEVKQKYDNAYHDWCRSVFFLGLEGRPLPNRDWETDEYKAEVAEYERKKAADERERELALIELVRREVGPQECLDDLSESDRKMAVKIHEDTLAVIKRLHKNRELPECLNDLVGSFFARQGSPSE